MSQSSTLTSKRLRIAGRMGQYIASYRSAKSYHKELPFCSGLVCRYENHATQTLFDGKETARFTGGEGAERPFEVESHWFSVYNSANYG